MTGKDPHDAKNHQPKRPLGAGTGKIAQGPYYDGRLKFVGDGRRLVELSKAPVKSDRGTPYPCYTKNLESYQRRPKRTQKTPMSNEVATSKLVNFLNQDIERGTKEYGALRRLAYGMQLKAWGPDLSVKAFDDLDLVFFRGVLATRTQIHYMTEEEILRELGPNMGPEWTEGHGQCFRRIIIAVDKRLQKYFKLRAIASWEPYKLEECGNSKVHHLGH
ncbi:MAG: hypothetical protein LQ343_005377 [Gyalolechia ehrenbergii]|nr:MAG: hypothetical protein LQ343_005377 [Gyalolechia ehrenbergii]